MEVSSTGEQEWQMLRVPNSISYKQAQTHKEDARNQFPMTDISSERLIEPNKVCRRAVGEGQEQWEREELG